ncbi:uncharacterized protein LOC143056648 [Mytilus galloprovincialis]|uniref:uncharacterized protein LOC143056648 n=1 Tax=Mytilus galloprovincialis TaxID=29158 RepID=UPI003F7C6BB1
MGRRSGRRNQARKSERRSLEILATDSNLFCEGEIKEAKGQIDSGDACHVQWDTYQMSLFGGIDDDQEDQSLFCTESIDTVDISGSLTKPQEDQATEICLSMETETYESEVSDITDKAEEVLECDHYKQKNYLMQEQEQKAKVGLSFRFRLIGYFRKKSGSSKYKKEIKEKNYKEGKRKESRYMSSIDILICCGCA